MNSIAVAFSGLDRIHRFMEFDGGDMPGYAAAYSMIVEFPADGGKIQNPVDTQP